MNAAEAATDQGRDRHVSQFTVHTSSLFDPKAKRFRDNISITVDAASGLIIRVFERDGGGTLETIGKKDIDLRGKYVLPGLVDAHTHVFLHSYEEADALHQKRDESMTERIVRGVNHCRVALLAGYTTYRDLGTEGMQDADANLRDTIARGLTPGPRLFVATREIASTGSFELRTENASGGHILPAGPDVADGVEQCRRAVRRRIAAGADIVKLYADYRRRALRYPSGQVHAPREPNPEGLVFTQAEVDTIVAEARLARCPVAAHCGTLEGARMAIAAGVTSVEHGSAISDDLLPVMAAKGILFVPTLSVYEKVRPDQLPQLLRRVKRAFDAGVRLACGGDTGTFAHGDNAREIELMVAAGVPVADVIEACTVAGWEACGGDLCGRRFGWFEAGLQADMIALDQNPEQVGDAFRQVSFVMKDGAVYKMDGRPT